VWVGGEDEFDDAFATAIHQGAGALLVNPSIRFSYYRDRLVALSMNRRTFIAGLGSTAAWPVMAHAQQSERVRRVGVLMGAYTSAAGLVPAFRKGLGETGYSRVPLAGGPIRWSA
jgi:hypothetical protein